MLFYQVIVKGEVRGGYIKGIWTCFSVRQYSHIYTLLQPQTVNK